MRLNELCCAQECRGGLKQFEPESRHFPFLADNLDAAIWLISLQDGQVQGIYANPACEDLWGGSLESLCRDPASFWAAVHPDDRFRLLDLRGRFFRGEPFQEEFRVTRVNGEVRWLRLQFLGLLQEQENQKLLAGAMMDITAQKLGEEARRQSEARLSAILACPTLGIALMDPGGKILESNRAFQDLLGHGGEIEQELRRLQETLERRQEDFGRVETCYLRRDGQTAWARLNVTLIRDGHGAGLFSVNLVENITGHRRAEEALKQSRERFRLLYDKAPLGYHSLDELGHFIDVNQTWLDILGYSRDEVIGRWFGHFLAPESRSRFEKLFPDFKNQGEINDVDLEMVRKDGSLITVSLNGKIAVDEQGAFKQTHCMFTDITARKKAEADREKWEKILSSTFNASHDLIMVLDRDLHVVMSNWRGHDLLPEQARQSQPRCYEYFRQRISPCDSCPTLEAFACGRSTTVECTDPDSGKIREIRAFPVLDEHGRVLMVVAHVRDITERRRGEEALKESERKYRRLVSTIPAVAFRGYGDWTLDFFDDKIEELTGYPKEDFNSRKRRWCEIMVEEDLEPARQAFIQALKTTKSYIREYRIKDRYGKIHWIHARGQIICREDGSIDYVSGVFFDVTREKEMEELLAAEKERLAVTLRAIGEGVIATDTRGNIVLMNEVAEQLTGWTQPEALGRPVSEVFAIFHEQTRVRCDDPVEEVIRTREVVALANSTQLRARDKAIRSIAASGAPIVDLSGQVIGVVLVFRDTTTERQTEIELLKMEKLSSLAILAGGIAHDFNNLLTGILGNISLALLAIQERESAVTPQLAEAEQATLRARDLVQQLLTFAKGGAPVKELASLAEIIKDSATFTCRGSQVRAEFDVPPDLWPGEVDTGQISQVIQNLIINAVQAMPSGGTVLVRGENVKLPAQSGLPLSAGRYIKISVRDHGTGIPQEHLAKIFDPYFSTKQKGSGLGLATAYSIITNHEGYMTVDSILGEGTTFHLYLPASHRDVKFRKKSTPELLTGKGKILVMDDDETVREVAGKILAHLGYQPDFARDGEEALEAYTRARAAGRPFDLVIMDLTIPGGMGGKEAIQKLRQIAPEVRAIVSSGYADAPIMTNYRRYGFKGVIKKPYRVSAFSRELHRVLSRD